MTKQQMIDLVNEEGYTVTDMGFYLHISCGNQLLLRIKHHRIKYWTKENLKKVLKVRFDQIFPNLLERSFG